MRQSKPLTTQRAFEKSARHILSQKRRCNQPGASMCCYAGPDLQSCAVGVLLPRKLAQELDALGAMSWGRILDSERECAKQAVKFLKGVDAELLNGLQQIHDQDRSVKDRATHRTKRNLVSIKRELQNLGQNLSLKVGFLDRL